VNATVVYRTDTAKQEDIARHLWNCDTDFRPSLSTRVDIDRYADKIFSEARSMEAWSGHNLVGLVAGYCSNGQAQIAFITNVSVMQGWKRQGIARNLLKGFVKLAKISEMRQIRLEVADDNLEAIGFYVSSGFVADPTIPIDGKPTLIMSMTIADGNVP
jgi:ribosomal protein S18 acetylase RimI-like enzyme